MATQEIQPGSVAMVIDMEQEALVDIEGRLLRAHEAGFPVQRCLDGVRDLRALFARESTRLLQEQQRQQAGPSLEEPAR